MFLCMKVDNSNLQVYYIIQSSYILYDFFMVFNSKVFDSAFQLYTKFAWQMCMGLLCYHFGRFYSVSCVFGSLHLYLSDFLSTETSLRYSSVDNCCLFSFVEQPSLVSFSLINTKSVLLLHNPSWTTSSWLLYTASYWPAGETPRTTSLKSSKLDGGSTS